jgi:hypothetical protein
MTPPLPHPTVVDPEDAANTSREHATQWNMKLVKAKKKV